jgi:hypothetical protein
MGVTAPLNLPLPRLVCRPPEPAPGGSGSGTLVNVAKGTQDVTIIGTLPGEGTQLIGPPSPAQRG